MLGNEVLRRLAGSSRFAHTRVLAKEPMATSVAQVRILEVADDLQAWQRLPACARMFHSALQVLVLLEVGRSAVPSGVGSTKPCTPCR